MPRHGVVCGISVVPAGLEGGRAVQGLKPPVNKVRPLRGHGGKRDKPITLEVFGMIINNMFYINGNSAC